MGGDRGLGIALRLKVSFAGVQNHVMRMAKLSILREVTARRRDRVLTAPEILQVTGASDLGGYSIGEIL